MRRLGGLVLFALFAGCGPTAVETTATEPVADAPVAAVVPSSSTTTTTSTTVRPTTTTTAVAVAPRPAVATTRAPATPAPSQAAGGCNPNYAGACIPTGPDVDCGDIAAKRFRVVGQDVYRLDADKDGIACET